APVMEADAPPGLVMTIFAAPTAPAGTVAVSVPPSMTCVTATMPSKATVAPASKPLPWMVIVPPPLVELHAGVMLLIDGPVAATVIDGPMLAILPPAFITLRGYVPGAMSGTRSMTRV